MTCSRYLLTLLKHLKELRLTVKEVPLDAGQSKNRSSVDKLSKVATEAEYEIKIAKEEMEKEIDKVLTKLSDRISDPLNKLSKRQASIETLLKKVDREKIVLQKSVSRAEKLAKFFKKDVPYEEVLKDIEDKKYADAKHLLSMGYKPKQVAQELGMPISEVNFLASVSP